MKENSQPKGMIVEHPENCARKSVRFSLRFPWFLGLSPEFYQTVKEGDTVIIDADHETVTIMDWTGFYEYLLRRRSYMKEANWFVCPYLCW